MKKIFILVLVLSTVIFSQTNQTSTIAANDSLGSAIKLYDGEVPAAIFLEDTLSTEPATVQFYLSVGDTTGKKDSLDINNWLLLTDVGDTTAYSIPIKQGLFIPLKATVFFAFLSSSNNYYDGSGTIYLRPKVVGGTTVETDITIRMRKY